MEVERAKPTALNLDRRSSMDAEVEARDQEFMAGNQLRLPLAGPAYQPYVSELLSFSIERLHKEPELLKVEGERVGRQMQEVAVENYSAFISAAEAISFVRTQLEDFDKHLESLISEIPNLTSGCTEFIESAQQIVEERRLNQTLLANHSTILDLLEIPQLMDTCIRNGNYDEALDLEAFVNKLSKLHSELPIIQALATDVKKTTQSMVSQILQKLRSNIQLSECLRIVAHLRRIGVFAESELRLQFLRCRGAWLSSSLEDLDQRNVYDFLKGMVNCYRTNLFDVVTQYRAIFSNDKSGSDENYDGGLLFSWAMHQVKNHLSTLEELLPKITDGGSLSNILDQCMYCAIGLRLVGLDFRALLPPIFESAVFNLFSKNMSTAFENFQVVLDSHRWVPMPSVGFANNGVTDDTQDDVTPPFVLMEHPPLAVFVNGVSAAMNELRPCAPLSLKQVLAQEVVQGLQAVSDSLVTYNAMHMLRGNESSLFLSLCHVFMEVVYPYCASCFGRCYPNGAALIIECKSSFDGISQLLTIPASKIAAPPIERRRSVENGSTALSDSGPPSVEGREITVGDPITDSVLERTKTLYTCPIYYKSAINMTDKWLSLDEEVAATIMPEDYRYKVWIFCNDCHKNSEVYFHVLGHKRSHCQTYNTRTTGPPATAVAQ